MLELVNGTLNPIVAMHGMSTAWAWSQRRYSSQRTLSVCLMWPLVHSVHILCINVLPCHIWQAPATDLTYTNFSSYRKSRIELASNQCDNDEHWNMEHESKRGVLWSSEPRAMTHQHEMLTSSFFPREASAASCAEAFELQVTRRERGGAPRGSDSLEPRANAREQQLLW